MGLVCLAPPRHEPVDLVEMKEYLRVTSPSEDRLISQLIRDARQQFDGEWSYFSRALVTQQWRLTLDGFPINCPMTYPVTTAPPSWPLARQYAILMPLPPLQSVQSITYVDSAGALQTLDPTKYQVDVQNEPGQITPTAGTVWPPTRIDVNVVTITFTAGYGTAPLVPEDIKTWIKQVVAYRYDNRSQLTTLPNSFFDRMSRYKVAWAF